MPLPAPSEQNQLLVSVPGAHKYLLIIQKTTVWHNVTPAVWACPDRLYLLFSPHPVFYSFILYLFASLQPLMYEFKSNNIHDKLAGLHISSCFTLPHSLCICSIQFFLFYLSWIRLKKTDFMKRSSQVLLSISALRKPHSSCTWNYLLKLKLHMPLGCLQETHTHTHAVVFIFDPSDSIHPSHWGPEGGRSGTADDAPAENNLQHTQQLQHHRAFSSLLVQWR